ncbi:glycosyltransferase family 4 protein [Priestia megaterium]|uniref:glycosyltransferase family 4 protein n=1 Tax=Priestia megaterium TaxID=1404 RepID=UPI003F8107AF
MQICHICSNYDGFFTHLMEEQISKNIDLNVFYFRARERGMPSVTAPYVDIRLNYSNWHRPFFYLKERSVLRDFFNIYKKGQFNINHAHTLFSNGYIALKAKEKWGTPYIVAVRDVDINIFLKYRVNLRSLGLKIMREAENIIFLSSSYKEQVFEKYIPKELQKSFLEKTHIIPNGVNPFFLENKFQDKDYIKEKDINILTIGYICKRKNQLTVCKAIEVLNKSGFNIKYTIVGKSLDDKLLEKIKSYPFVTYVPYMPQEEVINQYRRADIFVMPSLTETFGLVYAEAMSQGLPIIYTKGQGFDGQFEEGEVGYSVDCINEKDIAQKIVSILDNYPMLSNNARNLCEKFNWQLINQKYLHLYGEMLNGKD